MLLGLKNYHSGRARGEVDAQMRRLDGDDVVRVDAVHEAHDGAHARRRLGRVAAMFGGGVIGYAAVGYVIRADLDRHALLRPKTVDLSYSNAVQP